jgi:anti-sigma factor RsiW
MNCSDVVTRFTDYLDGLATADEAVAIERHLEGCPTCVRYKVVLEHGATILRSLPEPELQEDFTPRLQHRLYHVDEERTLSAHATSGASAVTVLGIAVVLALVAWSPTFFVGAPVVELAPIVVDREPRRTPFRAASASPPGSFSTTANRNFDAGLWTDTQLYDYTLLSQRYERRPRARRAESLGR